MVWQRDLSFLFLARVEHLDAPVQVLIDCDNTCIVATSIGVVYGRPNWQQVLLRKPVPVSFHYKLMCSHNQSQVIQMVELRSVTSTEQPACSSWGNLPSFDIVRVRPHQVTESTLAIDLLSPLDQVDWVESFDVWREASVKTENLVWNDCTDR